MRLIRSLLFSVTFYTLSLLQVLAALVVMPFSDRALMRIARSWSQTHHWAARVMLGQHVEMRGQPVRQEAALYVFKHESMYETIDVLRIFDRPAVVAKQELVRIPLWGRVARAFGIISIDRAGGATALREMMRSANAAKLTGRPIVLFAEGTRVPHGQRPPLQSGFAGLYKLLRLPVIPVAVNTGLFSPKGSFVKADGTIVYHIGEPIPPGLPRDEIEARVHAAINMLNT